LEEFHRSRLTNPHYFNQRDNVDPNGPVVAGIMYARGLNVHSLTLVATIEAYRPFTLGRSTLQGGDTFQGQGVTLEWKPFAQLPKPGKKETNGRDVMYEQRVQGRDVLETFEESRQFFEAIKRLK
jgi:hypothetical protein